MITKTIIGLDVGRSAVKAVALANGLFYRISFPSLVCPATALHDQEAANRAELETVEVAGKRFFVGDTARLQGRIETSVGLSDEWIEGPAYAALVASTLKRLGAMGVPGLDAPLIVLGTPAALFGSQKEALLQRTQQIVATEMMVLPQPMGAFSSFYLDARGMPLPERRLRSDGLPRSWAVIDVGHFTTDFLLMKEGVYVERAAASSAGIHLAAENLVRILAAKKIKASRVAAEAALRTKRVFAYGERDVAAEVAEATDSVVQLIMDTADAVLSEHAGDLDGVLVAGGGAPIVSASLMEKWPHIINLENSRMAIADGYCRVGAGVLLARAMHAEKRLNAEKRVAA